MRAVNLVIEGSFCYRFNQITLSNRSKIRRNCDARRSASWNFTLVERRTVASCCVARSPRVQPANPVLRPLYSDATSAEPPSGHPPSHPSAAANHFYTRSPFGAVWNSSRQVQPVYRELGFRSYRDHSLRAFTGLNHKIVPERSRSSTDLREWSPLVRSRVHSTPASVSVAFPAAGQFVGWLVRCLRYVPAEDSRVPDISASARKNTAALRFTRNLETERTIRCAGRIGWRERISQNGKGGTWCRDAAAQRAQWRGEEFHSACNSKRYRGRERERERVIVVVVVVVVVAGRFSRFNGYIYELCSPV